MRLEEEKKKKEGTMFPDLFVDEKGNQFDPSRKFGVIDKEALIYDNLTYSY
jgi:hypothetical protein